MPKAAWHICGLAVPQILAVHVKSCGTYESSTHDDAESSEGSLTFLETFNLTVSLLFYDRDSFIKMNKYLMFSL